MFYKITVVITWAYTFSKTHQYTYLKWMHFISLYQTNFMLEFNKVDFFKSSKRGLTTDYKHLKRNLLTSKIYQ